MKSSKLKIKKRIKLNRGPIATFSNATVGFGPIAAFGNTTIGPVKKEPTKYIYVYIYI